MSRSQWAWAKGCELVGAAIRGARRLGTHEVLRERLGTERPARTASSIPTLTWVATAVMVISALEPAVALGRSASRGGRAPMARGAQDASLTPVAYTERSSDPSRSSGPRARGRTARVEMLAFGSGYAEPHGSQAVRSLQRHLASLGYSPGPVDGRYGPLTEQAVIRFQTARHLEVDGIAGPQTTEALASTEVVLAPGDGYVPGGSGPVRTLQRHLAAAGFSPGPVDGRYGPLTERAVRRFQAARRLDVDGIAGPQTVGRLERPQQHPISRRPATRAAPRVAHGRPRSPQPSRPRSPQATRPASPPAAPPPASMHTTAPGSKRSGSPSPIPWVIVLASILATLMALLWHRRRDRDIDLPAAAADEPRDDHPGAGAFKLGQLLAEEGELAAAKGAFQRADQRDHPAGAFELGVLLAQEGDWSGAERAFRASAERGDARAAFALGQLLEQDGDLEGATAAYRRAEERGDQYGAAHLGRLLEGEGDLEGAKAAYGRADQRGDPASAYNLGRLLSHGGDRAGAVQAFRRAGDLAPPEVAELAHAALRELGVEDKRD